MHHLKKFVPLLMILGSLGALVTGVGFLRPPEQAARCTIVVRAPIEQVFQPLAKLSSWGDWHEDFQGLRVAPARDGLPTYALDGLLGERTFTIVRADEPYELHLRVDGPLLSGTWDFQLCTVGAGTEVLVTEHGAVDGPFQRGLHLFVDPNDAFAELFEALGARVEAPIYVERCEVTPEQVAAERALADE